MQFSSLDLAPDLQRALVECGYSTMTPVQEQAIVPARRGKDYKLQHKQVREKRLLLLFLCYNACWINQKIQWHSAHAP